MYSVVNGYDKYEVIGKGSCRVIYDIWNGQVAKVAYTYHGRNKNVWEHDNNKDTTSIQMAGEVLITNKL